MAGCHLIKDGHQVLPALGGVSVDVHLLWGEADPYQTGLAGELVVGERQARARAVVIHAVEAGAQDVGHRAKSTIAETIGVSDELHFVFHGTSLGSWMQVQCVRSVCVLLHTYTYRTGLILPRKGRWCPAIPQNARVEPV